MLLPSLAFAIREVRMPERLLTASDPLIDDDPA